MERGAGSDNSKLALQTQVTWGLRVGIPQESLLGPSRGLSKSQRIAAMPDDQRWNSGTHMVGRENQFSQVVL